MIVAVEPVAEMRAKLSAEPAGGPQPGRDRRGHPARDAASADAVVCAQAFHWFATEAALREIHRVLRPGGRLGLVWNVRDESVDWVAEITRIITPFEGDAPRFYKGDWRKPFASGLFGDLQMTSFAYQHVGSAQEVIIDRFLSVSFIAALPAAEKAVVEERLRALVASHPGLRGRDVIAFPVSNAGDHCCVAVALGQSILDAFQMARSPLPRAPAVMARAVASHPGDDAGRRRLQLARPVPDQCLAHVGGICLPVRVPGQ